MNQLMRSLNIGRKPEEERTTAQIELGDTVAVEEIVHLWSYPPPDENGKPHIDNGSAEIGSPKGHRMAFVYLGNHRKTKPLTEEEIEVRMNKLGWFRKEG